MSLITLQIGQCGNQIGQAFYSCLNQEAQRASEAHQAMCNETFFMESEKQSNKLTPKSILIDMEPKVVEKCLKNRHSDSDTFQYDKDFTFCKQEGSGNNWSYGYNQHGNKCKEGIMELVQKMLEKNDFCQGFMVMQSLAGGTGSGLGSFVVEQVADQYPEIPIINMCVMPHLTGEVILQSYNCILTIASLYQNSNGLLVIQNDQIQQICNKLLKLKSPSLDQMNNVIAKQLGSVFFPVLSQNVSSEYFSPLQNSLQIFQDITEILLLDPKFKLLSLQNVPQMPDSSIGFNNDQWGALDKRIAQMQLSNSTEDQVIWSVKPSSQNANRSLGNLVIYRGDDIQKYKPNQSQFLDPKIYKKERIVYRAVQDSHNYNKYERSISCLSNNQLISKNLEQIADRAHKMFMEKAYIYQYEQYGTSKDEIMQSMALFESIIQSYSSF